MATTTSAPTPNTATTPATITLISGEPNGPRSSMETKFSRDLEVKEISEMMKGLAGGIIDTMKSTYEKVKYNDELENAGKYLTSHLTTIEQVDSESGMAGIKITIKIGKHITIIIEF
jgi:hypothetical protein